MDGRLQAVLDIMPAKQLTFATDLVNPGEAREVGIEAAPFQSEPAHVDAAPTSPATSPATHVVAAEWSPIPTVPATHVAAAGCSSYQLQAYVPQLVVEAPTPRSEAVAITGLWCQCPECTNAITVCSSEEEDEHPIPDSDELEIERKYNESTAWWNKHFGEDSNAYVDDTSDEEMDGC